MKHIQFDKTICGVDFLLNILQLEDIGRFELSDEIHTADFFQIVYVKKGHGYLYLNDSKMQVSDYTVFFISCNQKYQWVIDKETFDATILIFQEDFLNDFFADKYFTFRLHYFYQTHFPLKINLSETAFDAYLARLKEAKHELKNAKSDSVHLIRSILYYVLIQLNRIYTEQHGIACAISQDNTAYQFRKLVEQHILYKQRIEDYTEMMGISRITLNKVVKQHFNLTATDFIKSRLLFEIKMQLIHTHETIAEISNTYHFSEPNHLTRFFKNKTGLSPVQYRVDYQNGSI